MVCLKLACEDPAYPKGRAVSRAIMDALDLEGAVCAGGGLSGLGRPGGSRAEQVGRSMAFIYAIDRVLLKTHGGRAHRKLPLDRRTGVVVFVGGRRGVPPIGENSLARGRRSRGEIEGRGRRGCGPEIGGRANLLRVRDVNQLRA